MFSIDGMQWTLPCDITRTAIVQSSDISGDLLNGEYFNDVEGTYMQYEITVCPNPRQMGQYYSLYQVISQPVDGHQFVFPYNDSTVEITARVEDISDVYVRMPNGGVYWKGVSFTAISNAPTKSLSLSESIQRGLTPLPDVQEPAIGDTYTYTENGWVPVND
jgi:hypothetical protein